MLDGQLARTDFFLPRLPTGRILLIGFRISPFASYIPSHARRLHNQLFSDSIDNPIGLHRQPHPIHLIPSGNLHRRPLIAISRFPLPLSKVHSLLSIAFHLVAYHFPYRVLTGSWFGSCAIKSFIHSLSLVFCLFTLSLISCFRRSLSSIFVLLLCAEIRLYAYVNLTFQSQKDRFLQLADIAYR
jgi:hypothetical protein